jgi:predicted dinucleotide-binding enzyme
LSLSVASVGEAIAGADVVVLALPYPEGRAVAREQGAALSGVTVVDTCNPVDFSTFDSLLTSPGVSAAEEIAAANPGARVVKAFNTTFASALVAGWVGGLPLDVFLAGDDAPAKALVGRLVSDGGMRPVDTGPLRRARELEAFQLLHMTLQGPLGLDWASAIKLLP